MKQDCLSIYEKLLTKLLFWLKKMVHIGAKSLIIPSKSEQKYFSF